MSALRDLLRWTPVTAIVGDVLESLNHATQSAPDLVKYRGQVDRLVPTRSRREPAAHDAPRSPVTS
jgi:hypothetical protein